METALLVAIISGVVALSSAAATVWTSVANAKRSTASAEAIETLRAENQRRKDLEDRQRETSRYSEPLARAAYDLQSRLYNILCQDLVGVYLSRGNQREASYVVENTTFLICQYFCWTELIRRDVQYIDLGTSDVNLRLMRQQDDLYSMWRMDSMSPVLRIFAGEQRAIGEALIQVSPRGSECMGYGCFIQNVAPGTNGLIDAIRDDVRSLPSQLDKAWERLAKVQNALIDLLELLDPDYIRFSKGRRSKVPLTSNGAGQIP